MPVSSPLSIRDKLLESKSGAGEDAQGDFDASWTTGGERHASGSERSGNCSPERDAALATEERARRGDDDKVGVLAEVGDAWLGAATAVKLAELDGEHAPANEEQGRGTLSAKDVDDNGEATPAASDADADATIPDEEDAARLRRVSAARASRRMTSMSVALHAAQQDEGGAAAENAYGSFRRKRSRSGRRHSIARISLSSAAGGEFGDSDLLARVDDFEVANKYLAYLLVPLLPTSRTRVTLDFLTLFVVLAYVAFAVPLVVACEVDLFTAGGSPPAHASDYVPSSNPLWLAIDIAVDAISLMDILARFRTAYRDKGVMVMKSRAIAMKYLTGWFPVDLLSLVPAVIVERGSSGQRRIARRLRLLKLLRLRHADELMNELEDAVSKQLSPYYLYIVRLLLSFVVVSHWFACVWYVTGTSARTLEESWMAKLVDPDRLLADAGCDAVSCIPLRDRYTASLYWSITTMTTVGYGDITASLRFGFAEQVVSILCMIVGVTFYGYFIGTMTMVMQSLSNKNTKRFLYRAKIDSVNLYMRQRGVPADLQNAIRGFYKEVWLRKEGDFDERKIFAELPNSLRTQLASSLTKTTLASIAFFAAVTDDVLDRVASNLVPYSVAPGDYLFREGEVGKEMFILASGKVAVMVGGDMMNVMGDGSFFGEIALLLDTKRTASIRAVTYCEMFVLSRRSLREILAANPELKAKMEKIATDRIVDMRGKQRVAQAHRDLDRARRYSLQMEDAEVEVGMAGAKVAPNEGGAGAGVHRPHGARLVAALDETVLGAADAVVEEPVEHGGTGSEEGDGASVVNAQAQGGVPSSSPWRINDEQERYAMANREVSVSSRLRETSRNRMARRSMAARDDAPAA